MSYPKLPYDSIQNWRLEEILNAAGVRYCLVGDLVVAAIGWPLAPISGVQLAVADEQLENARSILVDSWDYQEIPQTISGFHDRRATRESTTGFPGYRFAHEDVGRHIFSTIVMPASYWRLDLSPDAFETSTVPVPDTPCRFPERRHYLRALIDLVIDRFDVRELNGSITGYFQYHLVCIESDLKDIIPDLPEEYQFFLDLYYKVRLCSAKRMVCEQKKRIGAGLISSDEARALIPRKDLQLEAIKAKYRALADTSAPKNDSST